MTTTIQVSDAVRRFNALVATFDMLSHGQHDRYEPRQILDYLRDIGAWTLHSEFRSIGMELGYRFSDTSNAQQTVTVTDERLYGI
jgi:hypothetical protein